MKWALTLGPWPIDTGAVPEKWLEAAERMRGQGVKHGVAAGWPGRAWGLVESKGGSLRLSLPEGEAGKFLMRLNLVLLRALRAAGQSFNWSAVELYFDQLAVGAGPPVRPGRAAIMQVRWRTSARHSG